MRVEYEMIAKEARSAELVNNHLISKKCEWYDCFIKSNQEILLDLADFALQEKPEDKLMVVFFGHGLVMAHFYGR